MIMCDTATPASATGAGAMPSLPADAPAARPGDDSFPLRHGNERGNANLAPRCGARARSGAPCRAPVMANGRCRMHGGTSTGPRTPEGMARMTAARTTHGMYGMSSAPRRAQQRYVRTLTARSRLLATATWLRAYLPPEMAARLEQGPPELASPMHPSQVAFAMRAGSLGTGAGGQAPGNGVPADCDPVVRTGGGAAGGDAGAGRAALAAGLALRGRQAERLAARAEAAGRAPWRAAIAFARAAKLAACGASTQAGNGTTHKTRNNPMQQPVTLAPATGRAAEHAAPGASAQAGNGTTHETRNNPTQQPAPLQAATLHDPVGPRPGDAAARVVLAAAASPAWRRDATADQVRGGRAPATSAGRAGRALGDQSQVSRNDPMQLPGTGLRPGDAPGAVPRRTRLTPTKAAALRRTTLAGTWEPGLAVLLDPLFARAPAGWRVPQEAPPGWRVPQPSRVVGDTAAAHNGTGGQQPSGRAPGGMPPGRASGGMRRVT